MAMTGERIRDPIIAVATSGKIRFGKVTVGNRAREDVYVGPGDERVFGMKKMSGSIWAAIYMACFWTCGVFGQTRQTEPITLTVHTTSHGSLIPDDFVGLGFETASELTNHYGVSGYFFTPSNAQLITLFKNIGVKEIRVGGGTVDGSGRGGNLLSTCLVSPRRCKNAAFHPLGPSDTSNCFWA